MFQPSSWCILEKNGTKKILELKLDAEAKTDLQKSLAMTKDAIQKKEQERQSRAI
jgi:malate/lactate dehydrogenase